MWALHINGKIDHLTDGVANLAPTIDENKTGPVPKTTSKIGSKYNKYLNAKLKTIM